MAKIHSTINRRTFKHLTPYERGQIVALRGEGKSLQFIADTIGKNKSTISRELKRGTTLQKKQKDIYFEAYFPETGQAVYEKNRRACGRKMKLYQSMEFIKLTEHLILKEKWSPDAIVGRVKKLGLFKNTLVCVKTLYNYIDQGLIGVKNIDLALKVRRNTKNDRVRKNKKTLGKSISERPEHIHLREEFGHWEIDTVVGKKSQDEALLTLTERKTRVNLVLKITAKDEQSVKQTIEQIQLNLGEMFSQVFKTITSDNGSEFASLTEAVNDTITEVYFTHPFSAFERGTNEKHNSLVRRFIPKGKPIKTVSSEFITKVTAWCNELPRKILGYKTPMECFREEIRQLNYAQVA